MKCLVTGSEGFIGRSLIASLTGEKYQVFGLDREIFCDHDWDLNLIGMLEASKPEVIFHVGACSNTLEKDVQSMMIENYEFTRLVADWSEKRDCKVIYSSSAANYGTNGRFPSNLYGWSKYTAEQYVAKMGGVSLRYFNVYGPGEAHKGIMSSYFLQARLEYSRGKIPKLFPGKPRRDFVYIDDVVRANHHALWNFESLRGSIFDVGTCSPRLFEEGLELMGIPYEYHDAASIPSGYQSLTCANSDSLMPGWVASFSLELGLKTYFDLRTHERLRKN